MKEHKRPLNKQSFNIITTRTPQKQQCGVGDSVCLIERRLRCFSSQFDHRNFVLE